MTHVHPLRLFFVTATLSLLMLSLVVLPSLGALPELEAENYSSFDQVEKDDDLEAGTALGVSCAGMLFSGVVAACPDLQSVPVSIVPPPPNQA